MGSLLDVLLPPPCVGCARVGRLFCQSCRAAVVSASDPSDRFVAPDAGVLLGEAFLVAVAACAHEGPVRRALAALKYTGTSRLAPVLAALARPSLDALLAMSGPATLVPVPVHRDRFADRGYNQAALIAGSLGRDADLPMRECLVRVRATTKQHRLDRVARLRNLRDAFAPIGRVPATAILVDDIVTTSATLEACASALGRSGCRAVYGIAVAREI